MGLSSRPNPILSLLDIKVKLSHIFTDLFTTAGAVSWPGALASLCHLLALVISLGVGGPV